MAGHGGRSCLPHPIPLFWRIQISICRDMVLWVLVLMKMATFLPAAATSAGMHAGSPQIPSSGPIAPGTVAGPLITPAPAGSGSKAPTTAADRVLHVAAAPSVLGSGICAVRVSSPATYAVPALLNVHPATQATLAPAVDRDMYAGEQHVPGLLPADPNHVSPAVAASSFKAAGHDQNHVHIQESQVADITMEVSQHAPHPLPPAVPIFP